MDLINEYLKIIEDVDLCTISYSEFAVKAKNIAEEYHNLQLLQTNVSSSCKHKNLKRGDGLAYECVDCGIKNYK